MNRFEPSKNKAGEPVATFRLRDYLVPGGKYPYSDLAKNLEDARKQGHIVYLYSVPGFMIVSGYPDVEGEDNSLPWHDCDEPSEHGYYATAKEALQAK